MAELIQYRLNLQPEAELRAHTVTEGEVLSKILNQMHAINFEAPAKAPPKLTGPTPAEGAAKAEEEAKKAGEANKKATDAKSKAEADAKAAKDAKEKSDGDAKKAEDAKKKND